MATAQDLINDALSEIQVIEIGATPETAHSTLALSRLNTRLELLNEETLLILSDQEDIYLLSAYSQSPTIGASGTYVATRPIAVDAANIIDLTGTILGSGATTGAGNKVLTDGTQNFTTSGVVAGRDLVYVVSGTSVTAGIYAIATVGTTTLTLTTNPGSSGSSIVYRVIVVPDRSPVDVTRDVEWWAGRRTRGTIGTPEDLFFNAAYPNATLNLYPLTDVAAGLELFTKTPLTSIASVGTTLSLAPAYYGLLLYDLAAELCPTFGKSITPELATKLAMARSKIKSKNSKKSKLTTDVPVGTRW